MINVSGHNIDVYSFNTIVIGSGAAGLNAIDRLYDFGRHDIALVTEGMNMGTSRNTGSDKQTYYKPAMSGDSDDGIRKMAESLFDGGSMHGDIAFCEAALSARCFYKLVEIGVPFPHNQYGEYTGYKTDHDPRQRATSAGPLTSKYMTEKLEEQVRRKNINIFDGFKVISILTENGKCIGALALNKNETDDKDKRFVLFKTTNTILATGGPAGLYSRSVYPVSQTGSNGIAFEAGVKGRNLTEWQYGIASVKFRWNLSGSYQQVIPRYVSTDMEGGDEWEFLDEYFPDSQSMLNAIFLKGYQWPFDSRKIKNCGSSLIDILVHNEIHQKGRRVFLDFKNNPSVLLHDFSNIGEEAYCYLSKSGALQQTPVERLRHLNSPALDLYEKNNIDLNVELLEIAVCAQHNNGGLAVNNWWETNIKHLFAVGEAAGSHGVYRPGGAALNSGQAGSTRAAMFIAKRYTGSAQHTSGDTVEHDTGDFGTTAKKQIISKISLAIKFLNNKKGLTPLEIRESLGDSMSKYAAHIRRLDDVQILKQEAKRRLKELEDQTFLNNPSGLTAAFENVDLLIAQYVYAAAMEDYIEKGGESRGSCIVRENIKCDLDISGLTEPCKDKFADRIQEILYNNGECATNWENVRPIPERDDRFETVWRKYINDEIIG
jgi:succinate dehydrogenase/fumarate reductase flavoprotein subunit